MKELLFNLKADTIKMSKREHLYYWILPMVILSILFYFYFSGIPALVEIVAPTANWEWGILENIQLAVILAIFILSMYACIKKTNNIQKWGFFLISLFTIFVFLEEIDYGAHFVELVRGSNDSYLSKYTGLRNIHNQGNNAKIFKRSVYLLMALLFIVGPHLKKITSNNYINYLLPQPKIAIIAIMAIFVDLFPRFIIGLNIRPDAGLGVNIGEFSEIIVYYIFFIYVIQLVFINRLTIHKPTRISSDILLNTKEVA